MNRTPEAWASHLSKIGALWQHDGALGRPHALLTSGKHSSGFFNGERVMEDPKLLSEACSDLAEVLHREQNPRLLTFNCVVGPAMGAITFAHEFARIARYYFGGDIYRAYTEKSIIEGEDHMVFDRTRIRPRDHVLFVEDVVTTGKSIRLAADAVEREGGLALPAIMCLVNRSGSEVVDGRKIFSLIQLSFATWNAEVCPMCAGGSEAIRPKGAEAWHRLMY